VGTVRAVRKRFSKSRGTKVQALGRKVQALGRKIQARGRKIQVPSFRELGLFRGLRRPPSEEFSAILASGLAIEAVMAKVAVFWKNIVFLIDF
jgi:hypothetical protein